MISHRSLLLALLLPLAALASGCASSWRRQLAKGDDALHAGQLRRARSLYARALTRAEVPPARRDGRIQALNSLAVVELAQGKTHAAERHARGAVAALEEDCPSCSATLLATALFNLASITATLGKSEEAEALYARAVAGAERIVDFDALELSERLAELGQFQLARGRYAEAEAAYSRALSRREKALGRYDPALAPLLEDLAAALQGQQRAGEAQALEQRARAIGGARR